MMWWSLLILSVAGFWLQASGGIAPGDESTLCVEDPRFETNYPNNQRVLLDSYNYHNLLQHTVPGSPWTVLNADTFGNGWVQEQNSVCRKSVRVCDFQSNEDQSNWLFTQYISYHSSREVYVNISFNLAECRSHASCNKLFLNVYFYSTNQQELLQRIDPINYEPIGQIRQPQNERSANQVIRFNRPMNHKGFYLGIEDVGSCGNITRVQVFYKICPAKVVGLVTYPSLALPPLNSLKPSEASGHCAVNSLNTTSFQYRAFLNGTCQYESKCVCKEGYRENVLPVFGSSLEISVCEACPPGTYKTEEDVSCQICPRNTNTSVSGAAKCACINGYFRTPNENSSTSCSAPPGRCHGIQVVSTTDTAITIRWTKPENTGRDDYYYNVYHSNPSITGAFILHNMCPFVNQDTIVEYTVKDLLPQTNYTLRVVVGNGVSNQVSEDRHLRTCEVTTSTTDGKLGVPVNVNSFCKVITWEPPPESGSVVIGYDVRFITDGEMEGLLINKAAGEVYHIVRDRDKLTSQQDVMIQVRAKSSSNFGSWSDKISLGCNTLCSEDQGGIKNSSQITGVKVVNDVLLWNPLPSSDSALQYQVRYREIESEDDIVVSVEEPLHAFVLNELDQGGSYTVQIRAVNGSVTGNWSDPYRFSSFNVFRSQRSLAIVGEPQNVSAQMGSNIGLSCSAISGSGPLIFVWGTTAPITTLGLPQSVETNNADGSITSSIMLRNVNQEYSGEYLCIVMDSRGSRIVSTPANVTVTEDSSDVIVMFGAELYNYSENIGLAHMDIVKVGNNSRPFSVRITLDRPTLLAKGIVPSLEEFNKVITFDIVTRVISVNISISDDKVALEDTEILVFQLASTDVPVGDPAVTRVQINDDDRMSIGFTIPLILVEESRQEFDVCINRSHTSVVPLAVIIVVHPISATPGEDVRLSTIPTSVIFDNFSRQKCFSVEVMDNSVYEETESFQIIINSTNASSEHISVEARSVTVQIDDDDEASFDIKLVLNGQVYFNNSVIALDEVEEGDSALICMTANPNCCDGTNRIGEFYYPNGDKVPVRSKQNGFFRGRGSQFIRLNRLSGITTPTGLFKCEILNGAGVLQNISFTLSRNMVSFSKKSYFFLESTGEVEVCVDKVDVSQVAVSSVQVVISGSLQEETGQRIDQTLTFLPDEGQKCISFTLVDDTVALEDTEMLTFSIDHVSTNSYVIGDAEMTVGIVDDDVLTLSLGSLQNVTEGRRMDLCVYFSTRFASQFDIILNSGPQDTGTISTSATRDTDYTLAMLVSANISASAIGRVCSPIQIVNDSIAEPVECSVIGINVSAENDQIVVSTDTGRVKFCIEDNDVLQVSFGQPRYMFLESNKYASVCVDKHGLTEETVQVMITGEGRLSTINQMVTFLPHEQTKCVDVLLLTDDDIALEDLQRITLTLSSVAAINITFGESDTTSIVILDDDELVVTVSKASNLTEGDSGEVCVDFSNPFAKNFKLSISTAIPINVTIPVLATPDIDYIALPLSIMTDENANNTGRLCFTIEVLDDTFLEPVECLPITISFPDDLMEVLQFEATDTIVCCITDNDVVIGFSQTSYTTSESRSQLEVTVCVLEGHITGSHLVTFNSADGTAIAGEDYNVPQTTQLHFDSTVTQVNVLITILDDDVVEQKENFFAMLSTTDRNVQVRSGTATIMIEDDDASVERSYTIDFEESDYQVNESAREVQVCLIVLEEFPISEPFSIKITATENVPSDALAGLDFLAATRTATFNDKLRKACVSFTIVQDSLFESVEEHFTVVFSIDPSSLDIRKGMVHEAVVRIVDDDQRNMYFQLNGVRIPYSNHTSVDINNIGERDVGLMCVTDNVNCCGLPNRAGEWYYPDGTRIGPSVSGMDFYRGRSRQTVQLHRRNNAQGPTGRYCCEVPDSNQVIQSICINIVNSK